jgi:hypothetical protein
MMVVPLLKLFAETVHAAVVPPSKLIVGDPVVTRLAIVPAPVQLNVPPLIVVTPEIPPDSHVVSPEELVSVVVGATAIIIVPASLLIVTELAVVALDLKEPPVIFSNVTIVDPDDSILPPVIVKLACVPPRIEAFPLSLTKVVVLLLTAIVPDLLLIVVIVNPLPQNTVAF